MPSQVHAKGETNNKERSIPFAFSVWREEQRLPVLTAELGAVISLRISWEGGGCKEGPVKVLFSLTADLLSAEDLELAVGHLYRLSFLEEESQSW